MKRHFLGDKRKFTMPIYFYHKCIDSFSRHGWASVFRHAVDFQNSKLKLKLQNQVKTFVLIRSYFHCFISNWKWKTINRFVSLSFVMASSFIVFYLFTNAATGFFWRMFLLSDVYENYNIYRGAQNRKSKPRNVEFCWMAKPQSFV